MMEQKVVTALFAVSTQQEKTPMHRTPKNIEEHYLNSHSFPQIMQLTVDEVGQFVYVYCTLICTECNLQGNYVNCCIWSVVSPHVYLLYTHS